MKEKLTKKISALLIMIMLLVSSTPAYAQDWGKVAGKSVAKCASGFISRWAVKQLLSMLKFTSEVSTIDNTQANNVAIEACMRQVGVSLAKEQLGKMTTSTINWVNGGLNGADPLFVQDIDSLISGTSDDIFKNEISGFAETKASKDAREKYKTAQAVYDQAKKDMDAYNSTQHATGYSGQNFNTQGIILADKLASAQSVLDDAKAALDYAQEASNAYPYGRSFAQSQVISSKAGKNFQDALKSDLTNYLEPGSTSSDFATDFSKGGWDGWLALTQHPQNNPEGFTLAATENIANKEETAKDNKKTELTSTGFLAAKKCVLPKNYDAKSSDKTINTCQKWETTTPGELVKDQVSKTMSSPQTQLEMVRTLDDALTALFDSLIDNLQKNGLNGISTAVNNGTTGITISIDGNGNIIDGNSPDAVYGAFSLKDLGNTYNSDGTILKRGVIQIQKDYIDSVNTNLGVFAQIMPSLGELDYCIPGPNTNWEANSQDEIQYQTENANQTVHSGFLGIGSSGNPVQKSQAEHYLAKLDEYRKAIAEKFGPNSPMLDPKSGTGYLSMARAGLELTSNIVGTADNVYNTDQKYKGYLSTATSNLPQLNAIKNKYNDIVKAAQKRREQDNKNNGIASTPASCAKDELIN